MDERLHKELKRLSKEMQLNKNPDNIIVMEAMCEIEDLQAKFDEIQHNYVALLKQCKELADTLICSGNEKLIHPDWLNPNWQIGYIAGLSDAITMIEKKED